MDDDAVELVPPLLKQRPQRLVARDAAPGYEVAYRRDAPVQAAAGATSLPRRHQPP